MGMYNSVDCHYPLPMPEDPKGYTGSHGFQTKDFECALDVYIIDKDGQLLIERRDSEWIEGDPNGKSFLDKMGHVKTIKTWLEPLTNTCTIQFYDFIDSNKTDYDYFITYEAVFINGKISSVKIINFEANENAKRKIRDAEFAKKNKENYQFRQTWQYKYFVKPYNRVISFIFFKTIKVLSFLSTMLYKIERNIKI
jgi:hypothetical protein